MVGPVPVGVNKFVLHAPSPDVAQIRQDDLLGVTVVLITCSYREKEFVRIGYYVNNEYYAEVSADATAAAAPAVPVEPDAVPRPIDVTRLQRNILADSPRVTRFPIDWTDHSAAAATAAAAAPPGALAPPAPAAVAGAVAAGAAADAGGAMDMDDAPPMAMA